MLILRILITVMNIFQVSGEKRSITGSVIYYTDSSNFDNIVNMN